MFDAEGFAERIRAHYPDGLTGIIAVGGTRTTYVLDRAAHQGDPGKIEDVRAYAQYTQQRYFDLIRAFFALGGQNLIVPVLSFQSFYERGDEYTERYTQFGRWLAGDAFAAFYQDMDIDPYFDGIDTLLHLPVTDSAHGLGVALADFQKNWQYKAGRRKIIWEIAPIPLFSFWKAQQTMSIDEQTLLEQQINASADLREIYTLLYRYYARAAYGTEIPIPNFYLGANRNGSLKLRAMIPISMVCGGDFKLYYTPYPTLFTTIETLAAVLEDLTFGKPLRSFKADYSGQFTEDLIDTERERVEQLSADPLSTLGLTRSTLVEENL